MGSLIDQILAGNTNAVEKLYLQFSPKISLYLRKHLPLPEDAQELLNDVFLDAIDSLPLLKKQENISSWLYKIAHNKVVDFYRKKKIKSVLLSQMPFLDIVDQEIHQPEFLYEKEKLKERIEKTLRELSDSYRNILKLHYEERIPVKKLATIFSLSFKATESLLFRARKSFQKTYERA